MLCEHKSSAVVMLNSLDEGDVSNDMITYYDAINMIVSFYQIISFCTKLKVGLFTPC